MSLGPDMPGHRDAGTSKKIVTHGQVYYILTPHSNDYTLIMRSEMREVWEKDTRERDTKVLQLIRQAKRRRCPS